MAAFGRMLDILDELRVKCPWDRKQTNESLRPNTIEETYELCDALIKGDEHEVMKELGDVLFMAVNLARYFKIDPDAALSRVCAKFKARFQLMEQMAAEEEQNGGAPLSGRSLEELDALWDRAKERLKTHQ